MAWKPKQALSKLVVLLTSNCYQLVICQPNRSQKDCRVFILFYIPLTDKNSIWRNLKARILKIQNYVFNQKRKTSILKWIKYIELFYLSAGGTLEQKQTWFWGRTNLGSRLDIWSQKIWVRKYDSAISQIHMGSNCMLDMDVIQWKN